MNFICFPLLLVSVTWAAPQLKLTAEEYKALKIALDGRRPLLLQSANPLWALKNVKSDNSNVYYNIGGKGPLYARRQNVHKNNEIQKMIGGYPVQMSQMQSKFFRDFLLPIYRDEVENINPISKRRSFTRRDESSRKRRDTYAQEEEEEEDKTVFAEELSFALSTGGGVLGGAVGGYLDVTGSATLKLIQTLENFGGVALGQLDDLLDRLAEDKQKSNNNVYGAPSDNNVYAAPSDNNVYGAPSDNNAYGAPSDNNAYGAPAASVTSITI